MRVERDSMGDMPVPDEALYGAETARAILNFPISGVGIGREMIRALGQIKGTAAAVNHSLGNIDGTVSKAIGQAAAEVAEGKYDQHFPVDIFQTGSGTSSNMNANEVIANRAIQILGGEPGSKLVHPNDHVNLCQSSNDVFPSAIHLAALAMMEMELVPALENLQSVLLDKSREFDEVIKTGRTHLQDALPIRLGQEFSGFASQIGHGISHLKDCNGHLRELAIGGTAVGTGVNAHPEFGRRMAEALTALTGIELHEAENHFEAQGSQDAAVAASGALKGLAVILMKMANDIRHLGSGPRLGLGELRLPAVQPGSSIMPGKVNPVIAEALIQACAQVIGNDLAISLGGTLGNFQLNTMLPLIARNLIEQIRLLSRASVMFAKKLLVGLEIDRKKIALQLGQSLALAAALAPAIGYDRAARIAQDAHENGKTVMDVAMAQAILPAEELEKLLDPRRLVGAKR